MKWYSGYGIDYLAQKHDSANTAVVLFHGYGADATDLAPLSQVLLDEQQVDWYFPQGLLEVAIGPMMSGRAWFSIENRNWDALMRGEIDDTPTTNQTLKTLETVAGFCNENLKNYENVFVGGFSQGAILTSHTFYRYEFVPKGLMLLSGYLVSPSEFPVIPDDLKVPFFQSHGERDAVLPISGAIKLFDKLQGLGLQGKFRSFPGGHEIPQAVLNGLEDFILHQL